MKEFLKTIPVLYFANSLIKDFLLSFRTWKINRRYKFIKNYQTLSEESIKSIILEREEIKATKKMYDGKAKLHIYFVGTYYDHEAYGFLQSLKKVGDVTVYYGPDGKYGINSSAHLDGTPATPSDNLFLLEHISKLNISKPIDFIIGTFLATTISAETLSNIQKLKIPIINIAMDDKLPGNWSYYNKIRMGAIGLAKSVTLTLETTKEFVGRYQYENYPCIYWPFGSDPDLFKPSETKDIDVVFVGNNYGKRNRLIEAIRMAGIKIECFGSNFPNGHIGGDKVLEIFSRAKIILGVGLVGHSSSIVTLKLRDFDGPMSGALYITNYNPDLEEFFELNKEIVTFKTIAECVSKIKYFLANENERNAIAEAGRIRSIKDHAWDNRIATILYLLDIK